MASKKQSFLNGDEKTQAFENGFENKGRQNDQGFYKWHRNNKVF